ncbi:MAG: class I SAM-dependent methyltransferase [Chloroflexota bacterium]|nr:class I SAM-dependent methyltransferase [Chloroflexota bacterium]
MSNQPAVGEKRPLLHSAELVNQQYQTSTNLDARIQLHERFSTNPYDWSLWVFDQFTLPPAAQILEVGCGTGKLWQQNLARIPPAWQITLSDQSNGMVQEARQNLGVGADRFRFQQFNMQAIPFPDASLDAVIANHMLYHVADLPLALTEIARVLKAGGHLYAATNGQNHLIEVHDLMRTILPDAFSWRAGMHFTLQDGAGWLANMFSQVELRRYETGLLVTEAAPLVAYVESMHTIPAARRPALAALVAEQIKLHGGGLPIQKETGLFCAVK